MGLPAVSGGRRSGAARLTGKGAGRLHAGSAMDEPAPRIAVAVARATARAGARTGRSAGEANVNVFSYKELRGGGGG